jgi:hypothetical protein
VPASFNSEEFVPSGNPQTHRLPFEMATPNDRLQVRPQRPFSGSLSAPPVLTIATG